MGKYKGIFWPALIGLGHIPKVKKDQFYDQGGRYKRVTGDEKMSFYLRHPVFRNNLSLFFNMDEKTLKLISRMTYREFCTFYGDLFKTGKSTRVDEVADAFNYLLEQDEKGNIRILSGFYSAEEVSRDPDKARPRAIFYKGSSVKPAAIVIPGGGFDSNVNEYEGFPYAMELHKAGYSVIIYNHRVGEQLHVKDSQKKGEEAVRDTVVFLEWLLEHEKELGISMKGYAVFGSSAGGLIATALTFSNYGDCSSKRGFPRPCMIAPIYGLDWNIEVRPEDAGVVVFTRVGEGDAFGFDGAAGKFQEIKAVLGEENFDAKLLSNFPHGSGLGLHTDGEGWMKEAIEFWENHQKK